MNKINLKSSTNTNRIDIAREIFEKNKKIQGAIFSIIQGEYDIVGGSIFNSPVKADETTLEKLFTGENSVIASWDNSRILKLREDFPEEDYLNCIEENLDFSTCPVPNDFTKKFQVGDLEDFYLLEESYGLEGKGSGTVESTSRIKLLSKEPINTQNIWKLRVFPSLNNFFYRLVKDSAVVIRDTSNNVIAVEYEFEKISKIKNNQDIEQYIQLGSSIGEGYAWPKVETRKDFNGNEIHTIKLDADRLKNKPIKYMQVDFEDPASICYVASIGRPSTQGTVENEKFDEPRFLVPSRFFQQDGNKIAGNVAPSDNFFFSKSSKITIQSGFQNWVEKIQSKFRPDSQKSWSGVITDNIKETVEFSLSSIGEDNIIDIDLANKYWDQTNYAIAEDIPYNALSYYVDSEEGFTIPAGSVLKFEDLMTHNLFGFSSVLTLPLEYTESAPYSLAKIGSILGAVLGATVSGGSALVASTISAVGGGFVGSMVGFQNVKTNANLVNELKLFYPASSYTTLWNGIYGTGEADANKDNDIFPIDYFADDRESVLFGIEDGYTSIKTELSDKYITSEGEVKEIKDLGKDIDNDTQPDNLWKGTNKVFNIEEDNYFIDSYIIAAISKTSLYITYYDADNQPVQTIRTITTSKRTGNQRNWTTIGRTSNWTANAIISTPFGDPIAPKPEEQFPTVEIPTDIHIVQKEDIVNASNFAKIDINSRQVLEEYISYETGEYILDEILVDTKNYNYLKLTYENGATISLSKNISGNINLGIGVADSIVAQIAKEGKDDFSGSENLVSADTSGRTEDLERTDITIGDINSKIVIPRSSFNQWITLESIDNHEVDAIINASINETTSAGLPSPAFANSWSDEDKGDKDNARRNKGAFSSSDEERPIIEIYIQEVEETIGDLTYSKLIIKWRLKKGLYLTYTDYAEVDSLLSRAKQKADAAAARVWPESRIKFIELTNN